MKHVLAIDGGGIRGVIPAMVLSHFEKASGKPIWQQFDLIAGTSTGGILALVCAVPHRSGGEPLPASSVVELYEQAGPRIFGASLGRKLCSVFGLRESKYDESELEKVLHNYLGDTCLSEAKTKVLIPTYEIEQRSPLFFKSWRSSDGSQLARHVARATSAAPTFFRPSKLKADSPLNYYAAIDGGMVANNPAMCAYVEAKRLWPDEEISVVSLGTGEENQPFLLKDAQGWGLAKWARPLLACLFDGASDVVDYQLRQILPHDHYMRIQVELDKGCDSMDDASPDNVRKLKLAAEKAIAKLVP